MRYTEWFTNRSCYLVILVLISFVLSTYTVSMAQKVNESSVVAESDKTSAISHKWGLGVGAILMNGRVTPALLPVGEGYAGGGYPLKAPMASVCLLTIMSIPRSGFSLMETFIPIADRWGLKIRRARVSGYLK